MIPQDYESVRAEAQRLANEAARLSPDYAKRGGCDFGVEANTLFRTYVKTYRCWRLPLPENRYGHELRCEVVMPEINRF